MKNPDDSNLLEVGRIDRAHGVKGEVIVSLVTDRIERLSEGSKLQTPNGDLTVQTSRPHQHRHLVSFAEIKGRESAEKWRGVTLLAEPIEDPDDESLWVHELIGAEVVDQYGVSHGSVTAVLSNPASDLLELEDGTLVPLTFAVDIQPKILISVVVPAGLFVEAEEEE
ncbi:MAG TPA: ribosome maturation factor RimM [Acidimicrobiales bacterium]|jgi:16S rRNA processing protein RimM|nr:ribosome maturation factor RimM [Acidimicrobiales bacterium]|tara:strand:- start:1243 stop:1746 length:504 start_codon:yes stop_codon:yes gene_type:complete